MDYTTLITSQHNKRPNFLAVVQALTGPLSDITDVLATMESKFDVDVAVGDQLDAVGRWVGLSRLLVVPLATDFFSFDIEGKGWNEADWKGAFVPSSGVTSLPDDLYRLAIRTRIAKNYFEGTNERLVQIMSDALAEVGILVSPVDNMDMSLSMNIYGTLTAQQRELILRGYMTPKPMGVRITNNELGGTGYLWFSLDSSTAGLDVGIFR